MERDALRPQRVQSVDDGVCQSLQEEKAEESVEAVEVVEVEVATAPTQEEAMRYRP